MIPVEWKQSYANIGGENDQLSKLLPGQEQFVEQARNVEFVHPGAFERAPGYVKINLLDINGAPGPYAIESGVGECVGMYDYQLSNGTQHLMYANRKNASPTYTLINVINPTTGAITALTTATPGDNRLGVGFKKTRFTTIEDILMAWSQEAIPFYWDGTLGAMRRVGLPPVAENYAAIAAQNTGGTIPDGTYRFRFTYYTEESTQAFHEGRVADAQLADESYCEVTVTAGGGTASIDLTMPALDGTTTGRYGQIQGRSIYMTTDQGSVFWWVADTTNAGAHTVNVTALPLTVNNDSAPNATQDLPPLAGIPIHYQGRVFVVNGRLPDYSTGQSSGTYHNDRVFVSARTGEFTGKRVDGKQQFPLRAEFSFRIDPGAGEPVTGLFVDGGILYATKRRKIYRIYDIGEDPDTGFLQWTYEEVNHATGCISPDSVAHTENLPIFCSERLVYMFNGRAVDPIGNPKEPLWATTLNVKRLEDSVAAYERAPQRNRYRLLCSTNDAPANQHDIMLEWDLRTSTWRTRDDIPPMSFIASVEQSAGEDLLYSADYEGFVYRWDPTIYNYGAGAQADSVLTGNPTSATAATLVDTGQAWNINEFKNVPIYITEGTGQGQRRVILSNTVDTLTISTGATDWLTNPDTTSKYEIGAYKSRYAYRWYSFEAPHRPKRWRHTILAADAQSKATKVQFFNRYDFEQGDGIEHMIDLLAAGAVFGTGVFGTAVFGGLDTILRRFGMGQKANWLQTIVQHIGTNSPFRVYGMSIGAQTLSHRRSVQYAEANPGVV